MYFEIDKKIFEHFPGMKVVTLLAKDLAGDVDKEQVDKVLNEAWISAGKASTEYGNPQSHPYIKTWADRMRAIGVTRKKFPSSIEAMVRRAGKRGEPFRISPLVDFYNSISLKYLVPAGAYDIDELSNNLVLGFSKEGDIFHALDSKEEIQVDQGEVSYLDGNQVITRHFI